MSRNIDFSAFQLKMIAIIAMSLDHSALLFLSDGSWRYECLRFVGRLTLPLMCFFLVEGFFHSRNHQKYLGRLLFFGVIAQPFYSWMIAFDQINALDLRFFLQTGNVLFTLALALLALMIRASRLSVPLKITLIFALSFAALYCDWGIYPVIFTLVLAHYYPERKAQTIAYLLAAMGLLLLADRQIFAVMPSLVLHIMPAGILLPPLFWHFYHGKKGARFGGRYAFYLFYPAHMALLCSAKMFLQ